jgi:hypothetical protein
MQVVGYVFLGLIAVGILFGLVFVLASLPDIARYRKIRRM